MVYTTLVFFVVSAVLDPAMVLKSFHCVKGLGLYVADMIDGLSKIGKLVR